MDTGQVQNLLESAQRYLAGGCFGMFRLPDEVATVFHRGEGSRIYDVTGREYIDLVMGSGPMILGHAHPAVVAAVQQQIALGTTYYGLNEPAIRLAEYIVNTAPGCEQVRFVSCGTEGTFGALRLARAFTGRDLILKFDGGWHGEHDYAQQNAAGHPAEFLGAPKPDSSGIPCAATQTVRIAPFNDLETALSVMDAHAGELAAVIVEPLQRAIRPEPGFLEGLREATRERGILLIFDEIVTGYRIAWGGAQEKYGVIADLVVYGKTISGGYPLAAISGRADILDYVDPARKGNTNYVFISGTTNGNPVSTTAGLATLHELQKDGVYDRLYTLSDQLRNGLETLGRERDLPLQMIGEGPVLQPFFAETEIRNYSDSLQTDADKARAFGIEMVRNGIFVTPGAKLYLSLAHTDEDIDRTLEAAGKALDKI